MHVFITALIAAAVSGPLRAQGTPPIDTLTIDQAVAEALGSNLSLLAEKYNLTVADARIITARLRPTPFLPWTETIWICWAPGSTRKQTTADPSSTASEQTFYSSAEASGKPELRLPREIARSRNWSS